VVSIEIGEIVEGEIVLSEVGVLVVSIDVLTLSLGVLGGQKSVGSLKEQFKLHVKVLLFLWAKTGPKQ
jgi:hypothetical protein